MGNIRNKIEHKIKLFSKMILIIQDFFEKKKYKNKTFLKELSNEILKECNINFTSKQLFNILVYFKENEINFNNILNAKSSLYREIDSSCNLKGGFISNEYDNKFTKILNLIDFILDLIKFIPNNILAKNHPYIGLPYGIISIMLNLFRNDYDFAFYSFLGVIPGIGGLLSSSIKFIHRVIRHIVMQKDISSNMNYYKQIQSARRVHDFLKDYTYESRNNPYIGDFENQFNSKEIENLYLK